ALEVYLLVKVGEQIGAGWLFLHVLFTAFVGVMLAASQGMTIVNRMRQEVLAGRPPARELLDGALVVLGGVLLVLPGLMADALGLFLLLPPGRALVRWLIGRWWLRSNRLRQGSVVVCR
ncbi:MAG TPA: FxsA family protein, partial [Geobacterales bacterium]|nr:FxsA family protein [Geobacterales bacterium]